VVHHHGRQAGRLGSRRGAAVSFNSLLGGGSPPESIVWLLGGVDDVEHATMAVAYRRRRSVKQQWSHQEDIARLCYAGDERGERRLADLFGTEYACRMASGQHEKSTGVAIGQVEMDAKCQQPSKRCLAGFGDSDAAWRDPMLPVAVQPNRQDAILMNRNGPVGDRLLVKVGGVDGESGGFQNSRREVGDSAARQLGTELGNREEQMSRGKDNARGMLGRAQ